jgi:hypothetical protein
VGRKAAVFPVASQTPFYSQLLYPQDGDKGGTWIASSNTLTVCLLNGAFENHISCPPYRLSRGLVVLAVFNYDSVSSFVDLYDLKDVEPFTMIIARHAGSMALIELRWDGQQKYIIAKNAQQPHIWSSVTLYNQNMMKERETWFGQWLQQQSFFNEASIKGFHHQQGQTDQSYSIRMNRPGLVSTVSITTIVAEVNRLTMSYEDLLKGEVSQAYINRKVLLTDT